MLLSRKGSHRALVQSLRDLTRNLKVPALAKFGLKETDIPDIIVKVKKSSSIRYNPVELDEAALTKILAEVL